MIRFQKIYETAMFHFFTKMEAWKPVIESVLHQEEGGIGKSIPDAQDFPRPKRFPEDEA